MISLLAQLFVTICIRILREMLKIVFCFFNVFTFKLLIVSYYERPHQISLMVYSEEKLHP